MAQWYVSFSSNLGAVDVALVTSRDDAMTLAREIISRGFDVLEIGPTAGLEEKIIGSDRIRELAAKSPEGAGASLGKTGGDHSDSIEP